VGSNLLEGSARRQHGQSWADFTHAASVDHDAR